MSVVKIQNALAREFERIAFWCEIAIQGALANMPARKNGKRE